MKNNKLTVALLIGTRDFFPAAPVLEARTEILEMLAKKGVDVITPDVDMTPMGAVETWEQVKKVADLFRANRDKIGGVLVMLPVFGPEKAIADTIRLSKLDVPVLVQAYRDDLSKMQVELRRDSWCGKLSVTSNLYQYGIKFTLPTLHTCHPSEAIFQKDLDNFLGVCRVVAGMRSARLGAIGARPGIFNTVRYSEKLLEASGISVTTVDLSEMFGEASRLGDEDPAVKTRVDEIKSYLNTGETPSFALLRMAKLGVAIDRWTTENEIDAASLQCWTSIQKNYGVNACTLMSMMSEKLLPTACEVDMTGSLGMYALQLASGKPSALVDWNNNYGMEENKCMLFHCGNWAKSFFKEGEVVMKNAEILATVLGKENTYGTVSALAVPNPLTYARINTDDVSGKIRTYLGQGRITDDELDTFGCRAVVEIPELQKLMRYAAKNGFEHHTAINPSLVADVLHEAFETYLGWDVYHHA